ncbi:MAG: PEP-CTERM/exosortase system-associated acyltransferase [Stellaceae bacterium]
MPDFADSSYDQHFDVLRADTPDRLDAAYRLRYQVYCVENRFEDRERCPDGREVDDDDDRSVHTLLVHRRSGAAIGAARLILPRPQSGRPLPIERLAHPGARALLQRLRHHRTAEVSRFAVSKEFRRRRGEDQHADVGFSCPAAADGAERRLLPHITFGLVRGILGLCLEYEIRFLAAVMEPALLRLLSRLGLDFEAVGPLVEHHGLRQPCLADIDALLRSSRDSTRLLRGYLEASGSVPAFAGPAPVGVGRDLRPGAD